MPNPAIDGCTSPECHEKKMSKKAFYGLLSAIILLLITVFSSAYTGHEHRIITLEKENAVIKERSERSMESLETIQHDIKTILQRLGAGSAGAGTVPD